MADVLVQALLPAPIAKWVRRVAASEGLPVGTWVRRLILQKKQEMLVRAWGMKPEVQEHRWAAYAWTKGVDAPLTLERVAVHPDGTTEFRALDSRGKPMPAKALEENEHFELEQHLRGGWVLLENSNDPWVVARQMADANADGQLVLFLRPLPKGDK